MPGSEKRRVWLRTGDLRTSCQYFGESGTTVGILCVPVGHRPSAHTSNTQPPDILHFTLYTLHSTLFTLHSTLYTLHSALSTSRPGSEKRRVWLRTGDLRTSCQYFGESGTTVGIRCVPENIQDYFAHKK